MRASNRRLRKRTQKVRTARQDDRPNPQRSLSFCRYSSRRRPRTRACAERRPDCGRGRDGHPVGGPTSCSCSMRLRAAHRRSDTDVKSRRVERPVPSVPLACLLAGPGQNQRAPRARSVSKEPGEQEICAPTEVACHIPNLDEASSSEASVCAPEAHDPEFAVSNMTPLPAKREPFSSH